MLGFAHVCRYRRKLARELLVEARVVDDREVELVHVLVAEALAQVLYERRGVVVDLDLARVRAREMFYRMPLA